MDSAPLAFIMKNEKAYVKAIPNTFKQNNFQALSKVWKIVNKKTPSIFQLLFNAPELAS